MKLPLSWLREYVDIGDITAKELADKLLNIGFEVEEIIELGKDIINVKTGKIISIRIIRRIIRYLSFMLRFAKTDGWKSIIRRKRKSVCCFG